MFLVQNFLVVGVSTCVIFFKISFCCIIRKINPDVNISSKTLKQLRKVLSHFLWGLFHQPNYWMNYIEIPFPFDIQFITFSFNDFFYFKFFLICFLQFFTTKTSSNKLAIQVINYICPWNCIFNFISNKNFLWPI